MPEEEYWNFGRKEVICTSVGAFVGGLFSLVVRAAPPWWFLPLRRSGGFDRWAEYASQGGYPAFWLQSLIGWLIVGLVLGLIFSNVILRGKSWNDD